MQATTSQAVPVSPRTALPWGARYECTVLGAEMLARDTAEDTADETRTITLDAHALRRVGEFRTAKDISDAKFDAWMAERGNTLLRDADARSDAHMRRAAVSVAMDVDYLVRNP